MAVNKITNKSVVNRELVNRANEVSTKGTTIRGNRETTIIPGNNFSDNYSITLKDVDTAILNHVKNVMKPIVREANETLKIKTSWNDITYKVRSDDEGNWNTKVQTNFKRGSQTLTISTKSETKTIRNILLGEV